MKWIQSRIGASGRLLAVVTALTALSADAAYEGHVTMLSSDDASAPGTGDEQSFDNNDRGRWAKNGVIEPTGPHAGERYYANKVLSVSNVTGSAAAPVSLTFAGDELVVGSMLWIVAKRSSKTADDATVTIPNLVIAPGGYIYNSASASAKVSGTCRVEGTDAAPSCWLNAADAASLLCGLDFCGAGVFQFRNKQPGGRARFLQTGNATGFTGVMKVCDGVSLVLETAGGFTSGGTVLVEEGGVLEIPSDGRATVGTLGSRNGTVCLSVDGDFVGQLTVTDSIDPGGGKIRLKLARAFTSRAGEKVPLLTLASGASGALRPQDFELVGCKTQGIVPNFASEKVLDLRLVAERAEDGSETLYAVHRPVVIHDTADGSNAGSAFLPANRSHWDDDAEVSPERDYYASGFQKSMYPPAGEATFAGASLTLHGTTTFNAMGCTRVTVPRLRLVPNERPLADDACVQMQCWSGAVVLDGRIEAVDIAGREFVFQNWNSATLDIASDISGSGTLLFSCKHDAAANPCANFLLSGDNGGFAGRIRLAHRPFEKQEYLDDPSRYAVSLGISGAGALGGALPAFCHDSLSLEDFSVLSIGVSAAFDEPTRGWCVRGVGRVSVAAGARVSLSQPVTYCGEFRKEGKGTLLLGGTPRFGEGASTDPVAGQNALRVTEGALGVVSPTALEGVAVSFAEGSVIEVNGSATGELKARGLSLTREGSSLSFASRPQKVRVALPEAEKASRTLGICTVSPAAASALSTADFAVAHIRGYGATVVRRENRDAAGDVVSVTFAVLLEPVGLTVILR